MDYIELTTLFPFERACQIVTRRAEVLLKKVFGCGRREMWVLLCITTNGRSQRDVGEHLGLHPNVVVKILDGMEEAGLLQRRRKREDRRAQVLEVTERGRAIIEQYMREKDSVLRELFAPLSDTQLVQYRELSLLIVRGQSPEKR